MQLAGVFLVFLFSGLFCATCAADANIIRHWPTDISTKLKDNDSFEYVIIGAGAAGAVLAAELSKRLSDSCSTEKVLLLEKGSCSPPYDSTVPGRLFNLPASSYSTRYPSEPDNRTCLIYENNSCWWTVGNLIGGSSMMSNFLWFYGTPEKYNEWDLNEWGWDVFETLFKEIENQTNINDFSPENQKYHGTTGPQLVGNFDTVGIQDDLREAFVNSWVEYGVSYNEDTNGASQLGVTNSTCTTYQGERYGVADCYLNSKELPSNLNVACNSLVTKIEIVNKTATGVYVEVNDKLIFINGNTVILSAGVVNSPQLLMLSGIGPAEHLYDMNITVEEDLPVGQNAHDMTGTLLCFTAKTGNSTAITSEDYEDYEAKWNTSRSGPLATFSSTDIFAFTNMILDNDSHCSAPETKNNGYPNGITFHVGIGRNDTTLLNAIGSYFYKINSVISEILLEAINDSVLLCYIPACVNTLSRGEIKLLSTDIHDKPLIYSNYFEHPYDRKVVLSQVRAIQALQKTDAMKSLGTRQLHIPIDKCDSLTYDSKEYWDCFIQAACVSKDTYAGTVSMGTVLDQKMKVKNITGLYVVDASAIPNRMGGKVQAVAMAMGLQMAKYFSGELD